MTVERVRARVFGEVADEYDRVRPGYPPALVDDVLSYAALGEASALEVGAGTGKATLAFAERGIPVTAVEPDEAMAAVLARHVPQHVTIEVCAFEDLVPRRPYGLLFSAQAWHWTDPSVRWQRAAAALARGGALALFWNHDRPAEAAVREALVAVYRDLMPDAVPRMAPIVQDKLATQWPRTDLSGLPAFHDLSERLYRTERRMSTADYVAFLSTHSAYRLLPEDARSQLFAEVAGVVGDEVLLSAQTALYLARRSSAPHEA